MPQPRSSTAVWIALSLIVASIACVFLGAENVRHASTPKGLSTGIFILFIGSLLGSAYFAIRLGAAGVMIIYGKPINNTVAWSSSFGALVHGAIVFAFVIATMVLAPPQGFTLVAIGVGLALVALFVMGQYPNLAETQGWDVSEAPATAAESTRPTRTAAARPVPTTPSAAGAQPAARAPIVAAPVVVAPPIATEAPRAAGTDDERKPSLLV